MKGLFCNATVPCLPDALGTHMIECVESVCKAMVNAGDKCDDDNICYSGLRCEDDYCQGIKIGSNCTGPLFTDPILLWRSIGMTCVAGAYCNSSNFCDAMLEEGDTCGLTTTAPCGTNLICDTVTSTCIKLFSKDENEECDVRETLPCEC